MTESSKVRLVRNAVRNVRETIAEIYGDAHGIQNQEMSAIYQQLHEIGAQLLEMQYEARKADIAAADGEKKQEKQEKVAG